METITTPLPGDKFEVKYLPKHFGAYSVEVKWGYFPLPGSPFSVRCSSAGFRLGQLPERVETGARLSFEVQLTEGGPLLSTDTLQVLARTQKGVRLRGKATLVEKGGKQSFSCYLSPQVPGNYLVGVKWNKLDIAGSPFGVKVVSQPKPWNVQVSGRGVQAEGQVGGAREFTVDTGNAGGGVLAVKIEGPAKELNFSSRRDLQDKRKLHIQYNPALPGCYSVTVEWAGRHVPGSPFRIDLASPTPDPAPSPPQGDGTLSIAAEVHPLESVAVSLEEQREGSEQHQKEEEVEEEEGKPVKDRLTPPVQGTGTRRGSHVSIFVEDSDSAWSDGHHILCYDADRDSLCSLDHQRNTLPMPLLSETDKESTPTTTTTTAGRYDREVRLYKQRCLPPQDSVESDSSLYNVVPETRHQRRHLPPQESGESSDISLYSVVESKPRRRDLPFQASVDSDIIPVETPMWQGPPSQRSVDSDIIPVEKPRWQGAPSQQSVDSDGEGKPIISVQKPSMDSDIIGLYMPKKRTLPHQQDSMESTLSPLRCDGEHAKKTL